MLSALGHLAAGIAHAGYSSADDMAWLALLGLFQLAMPCSLAVVCARGYSLKAPEVSLLALLEVMFGILLAWVGPTRYPGREVLMGGVGGDGRPGASTN